MFAVVSSYHSMACTFYFFFLKKGAFWMAKDSRERNGGDNERDIGVAVTGHLNGHREPQCPPNLGDHWGCLFKKIK